MSKKLLKLTLLAVGAAAVLLFSGSGYASKDNDSSVRDPLRKTLEGLSSEIPAQESADWHNAVKESPAFFFLLTAD